MVREQLNPRVRLNDYVYQALKENIMSQKLAPGERLHLEQLAEGLEVSMTPLKNALNQLASDGLVEIIPRHGFYVTNPSPEKIAESFEVRCALEIYAVQLVIERASETELQEIVKIVDRLEELAQAPDLGAVYQQYVELDRVMHHRFVELSGNQAFLMAYDREHTHVNIARERYGGFEDELDKAQAEHRAWIQAMLDKDIPRSQKILAKHINRAKNSLLREMNNHSPYS